MATLFGVELQVARESGVRFATLFVDKANPAQRLYAKMSFLYEQSKRNPDEPLDLGRRSRLRGYTGLFSARGIS